MNVVITLLISESKDLPENQKLALNQFNNESMALLDLTRSYLTDLLSDPEPVDKEQQLIDTLYFLSKLYFTSISFLNKYYNLQEEKTRWR
ncbi:hypothetical protein LCGC14_2524470 [marine sediment metagenome]|uniref:Uncharacterized protein n=1 Tax=marine sediment metagenome TaxID=412755 RepID=A0A0F9AVF2_9ZZZZ|nr:MAG: hypothetical protein Lokiarch_51510 [Candidatus Lokiarchaeum sp. GC14_75]